LKGPTIICIRLMTRKTWSGYEPKNKHIPTIRGGKVGDSPSPDLNFSKSRGGTDQLKRPNLKVKLRKRAPSKRKEKASNKKMRQKLGLHCSKTAKIGGLHDDAPLYLIQHKLGSTLHSEKGREKIQYFISLSPFC
jgi:hypothetical protein